MAPIRALPAPMLFGAGVTIVALFFTACAWMTTPSSRQGAATTRDTGTVTAEKTKDPYQTPRLTGEPDMRVRIGDSVERVEVGGPKEVMVRPLLNAASAVLLPTPLVVTAFDDAWRVRDGAGAEHLFPRPAKSGPDIDVLAVEPPALRPGAARSARENMLSVNKQPFPGSLRLHARRDTSPGLFDIVEHVPIESYLPGVVTKELYHDWKLETFKAQAIAARSYALQERRRRMSIGSHFDVEATQQDQAYLGTTDHTIGHRAVKETAGMVLTWEGRILRAYYSSTTAGRAASARDTWPTTAGFEFNLDAPIQASPRDDSDSFSPLFRWEVKRDRAELVQRIRAWGRTANSAVRNIDSVDRIVVHERNEFGRPRTYRIFQNDGKWYQLSAEQIRLACNHTDGGTFPAVTRDTRISSGDFEVERQGQTLIFKGRGFGHGVGMSQYGAEGMARRGIHAAEILKHYYPGAVIERAY